ncbi:cytochrome c maturation protein CcmE [Aliikangiella coralliicola]|uniref:Cytochrome c-type biogenesis protein CcmE n=1 Tax=Aliikangiella coralliicola TaxID=2592383 RepID=A0A545UAC1_9GAMM|nr:cytochrome c maturation protein CcmE [Aliikangiella coralliicola]TQV86428.1 cytochrome c maturation protein CcmE [Aliikangiella coralliicola]
MKPLRKRRLTFVISIVVGLGVAVGLTLYALNQNVNLFYSPLEIVSGEAPKGPLIRLGGLVVTGSIQRNPDNLKVKFQLTDNAENVWVSYEGILPDLFREGQGIVTMGVLQQDGTFVASEVLAKHDENYMSPEVAEAIKKAEAEAKARVKK